MPQLGTLELIVSPTSGLRTSEAGGTTTFSVKLATAPLSEVTVDVTSLATDEATVSPARITFTETNFSTPITVTVSGVDDDVDDGDEELVVRLVARDDDGRGDTAEVTLTNDDNDGVGATITLVGGLTTSEDGDSTTFTVVLDAQPTADVTIQVASSTLTEGTVEPGSLVFTPDNWDAPQIVTVTGVNDDVADGPVAYSVVVGPTASTDPAFDGLDVGEVSLTNIDNDSPGVFVTPTTGLETTESGGDDTFSVVLTSQPTADVVIGISSSDPTEGTTDVATLTFTAVNWDAPQIVTVTGVDDPLDDNNQSYTIVVAAATSADLGYAGEDGADVAVTNIDDEAPGFTVDPLAGLVTTEAGGTAAFTVRLVSAPTADVTISVSSSDPLEGTPDRSFLTFTPANFAITQTVTVTGLNDDVADGDQLYSIILGVAASADPAYANLNPPDVSITNTDNDSAGITVTPLAGLLVSELGDTATFTVVLNSQPTANVTIAITSNDSSEGVASPASLVFTPANWDQPRTVTITGVDDPVADGNQVFAIAVGAAVSADPTYSGINPPNPSVTNFDDDAAAVVVRSAPILEVSENGTTATFAMVLTSQPTANVTCFATSTNTNEGVVTPASVVFTPADFAQDHVFTLTGVDDTVVDGTQLFLVTTAKCQSSDPAYDNVNPRDLNARNFDND